MPYILSTLSNSQSYTAYKTGQSGQPMVDKQILIQGNANIPNKYLWTPSGAATQVTDAELEQLRANEVFKMHEKNGFIKVQNNNPHDIEKAVSEGMAKKDKSAPKGEDDFEEAKPVTNKKTSKK